MAKKEFKNNPALAFISKESIEKTDRQEDKSPILKGKKEAPAGYKPNPEFIETKSKRVQILIQPSVHDKLKARAKAEGTSVNELINKALIEYTER